MAASDKLAEKLNKMLEEYADRKIEEEEKALEALSLAKTRLMRQSPFFASLLFRMPMICNYQVPTMGTDGLVVLYNPFFVNLLKRKDLVFVMLHEIQHVLFKHPMRCPLNPKSLEQLMKTFSKQKQKDPFLQAQVEDMKAILKKWNYATDYAINLNIRDNVKLKPTDHLVKDVGMLIDDQYKDMTAEQIYKKLPDPDPSSPKEDDDCQGGLASLLEGDDGGQGMGGVLPVGMGELDGLEVKDAEKELDANVHAAAAAARKAGNLPGGMEKLIEDLYTTTTPWEDIMRTQISAVVSKMDYTWLRPNKRYGQHLLDHGVIMPGLYGEEYADMYFVMDTSGSVSDDDRAILASELRRILEDYNITIHLIYCDTQVQGDPVKLTRQDIQNGALKLELKGYGGTDFRPAFKYINEHLDEIEPEMVIYLTDMYPNTWSIGPEPPYSVFWACLPQGQKDAKPPWGQVVQIELEGRKK